MNRNFVYFRKMFAPNRCNRCYSKKKTEPDLELDESTPIKFSTSKAAQKTIRPLKKASSKAPWYEPYSVLASVSVFMLYFFVLREENDVDKEFTKSLYSRIKGLEKQQLLQSYRFNKEQGKEVASIEARLKELEEQEPKAVA